MHYYYSRICFADFRYPRFQKKIKFKKKFQKKISQKISENFLWNFCFQIFLGYHGSTSNLEHACKNLGGLGPLVWEEIENAQTVHKPKLKFMYRVLAYRLWNFPVPSGGSNPRPLGSSFCAPIITIEELGIALAQIESILFVSNPFKNTCIVAAVIPTQCSSSMCWKIQLFWKT
jgi:hypothetical protein